MLRFVFGFVIFCMYILTASASGNAVSFGVVTYHRLHSDNLFEIRIFPNPFKEYVSIEINSGQAKATYIKVFDIIGVEVMSVDLDTQQITNGIYAITLKDLKPGVYFCNVYSDKKLLESKRIISTK